MKGSKARSFVEALLKMPNVGEDSDFERIDEAAVADYNELVEEAGVFSEGARSF